MNSILDNTNRLICEIEIIQEVDLGALQGVAKTLFIGGNPIGIVAGGIIGGLGYGALTGLSRAIDGSSIGILKKRKVCEYYNVGSGKCEIGCKVISVSKDGDCPFRERGNWKVCNCYKKTG
ncbi:MAG: hypothetical protein H8D97_01080 [Proteobacteria bacterium]|nr:hypothetical protein [Pseudomonadota bacterium]